MPKNNDILCKIRQLGGWMLAIKAAGWCKISYIIGSCALFFSAHSIVVPMVGAFSGVMGSCAVLAMRFIIQALFGNLSLQFLAVCVPGFFASLYWAWPSFLVRCILPLACMALFIMHPVGNEAWAYTLYWLIPAGLYFSSNHSLFSQAVGSTFIAHAVGSVIWLYTVPMSATAWILLIPIVALERIMFASGMVMLHYAIRYGLYYHGMYKTHLAKLIALVRSQHA